MSELRRLTTNRSITAMIAADSIGPVGDRIANLFSFGRHVAAAQRRPSVNIPPDLYVGRQLAELERHDDGAGTVRLSVVLTGMMLPLFGFSTSPERCPDESTVWQRWHNGERTNMTRVQIEGGLPGDGPALLDRLTVWSWPSSGVCIETVVGFDLETGPHALVYDVDNGLALAGGAR